MSSMGRSTALRKASMGRRLATTLTTPPCIATIPRKRTTQATGLPARSQTVLYRYSIALPLTGFSSVTHSAIPGWLHPRTHIIDSNHRQRSVCLLLLLRLSLSTLIAHILESSYVSSSTDMYVSSRTYKSSGANGVIHISLLLAQSKSCY